MQLRSVFLFLVYKLARLGLLLAAVAVLTFVLLSFSPVDPVQAYVGADMLQISTAQRDLIAQRWGLDQPMLFRFGNWLRQMAQGNWGISMVFNQPVMQVIRQRFELSLPLLVVAWLLSGLLGVGLGVLAGAFQGTWVDRGIRLYAYTLVSSPPFWVALLLLIAFSVELGLTPICCAAPPGALAEEVTLWQRLHHLLLPAFTLTCIGVANIDLHTRQKLIDVLHSKYVLFARPRGKACLGSYGTTACGTSCCPR